MKLKKCSSTIFIRNIAPLLIFLYINLKFENLKQRNDFYSVYGLSILTLCKFSGII